MLFGFNVGCTSDGVVVEGFCAGPAGTFVGDVLACGVFVGTGTDTKNDTSKKADRKAKKTLPLKVTARKGKKTVTIKTVKKAVVKVTATKKVIYKGKKVTKTLTIPAKKNKTGKIVIKLSKPLNKNMKLKVTVSKKNYQTKKQTIKVK